MQCFIDWPVVMLDGPWVAARHSHFSCGTTISSDPELKQHRTFHPHTNMSFVQWHALEKSAQHVVDQISLCGTCMGNPNTQGENCNCIAGYMSVRAGECERVNQKNSKMPSDQPGLLFNRVHFKVLGQHRSTFPLFTLVKKKVGVCSCSETLYSEG